MLGKFILMSFLFLPHALGAQEASQPGVWKPFRYFVGSWSGTSDGQPGTSKVESKYEFILNGNFLKVAGKSVYPPQEKNPKGQAYEGKTVRLQPLSVQQ